MGGSAGERRSRSVGRNPVLTTLRDGSVEYCAVLLAVLDQPGAEDRGDGFPSFLGDEHAVVPELVVDADGVLPDVAASSPWGHALSVGIAGVGIQLARCRSHLVSVPSA